MYLFLCFLYLYYIILFKKCQEVFEKKLQSFFQMRCAFKSIRLQSVRLTRIIPKGSAAVAECFPLLTVYIIAQWGHEVNSQDAQISGENIVQIAN